MTVAMYLRLSSEDIDLKSSDKTESESISNQRGLLKEFLRKRQIVLNQRQRKAVTGSGFAYRLHGWQPW